MVQELRGHHRSTLIIKSFEAKALKARPLSIKIADALTSNFGTVAFLVINVVIYVGWIILNSGKVPGFPVIDPFPYSFLNSFVSLEAIFLTIIILMSQNRQNHIDTIRNEMNLQVNLIVEREITKTLRLMKETLNKSGKELNDTELEDMLKQIDTSYIERKLEEQISSEEKVNLQK